MKTRPRRSHHRPLQGKLDTRSLPSPKQFHLRLQPRCNQVQAASGRPCWSATSRGFTTPRVGVICHYLVGVLFGFPCFWAFSCSRAGVSLCLCAVCAWACSCGCVCVFVFRAWTFVVPSAFLRCLCCCGGPLWGRAVGVCWLASCPGRFSVPVSWVFSPGSRKTHGGSDESATRPHQLRKSSKLRAQQISRAKVESHSLSTLSVFQMARSELRL